MYEEGARQFVGTATLGQPHQLIKEQSRVQEQLHRLEKAQMALVEATGILSTKIASVLSPDRPEKEPKPSAPRPPSSDLSEQILSYAFRAEDLLRFVADLNDRVEL